MEKGRTLLISKFIVSVVIAITSFILLVILDKNTLIKYHEIKYFGEFIIKHSPLSIVLVASILLNIIITIIMFRLDVSFSDKIIKIINAFSLISICLFIIFLIILMTSSENNIIIYYMLNLSLSLMVFGVSLIGRSNVV